MDNEIKFFFIKEEDGEDKELYVCRLESPSKRYVAEISKHANPQICLIYAKRRIERLLSSINETIDIHKIANEPMPEREM